jgi:hypothetical protein
MINLNKESIKKLKDIDSKSDAVILDAEKKAETIISGTRLELPVLINNSRQEREKSKSLKIETAKKELEEKNKELIETGICKVLSKEEKLKQKIDSASDIAVELFIKKIESKGIVSKGKIGKI